MKEIAKAEEKELDVHTKPQKLRTEYPDTSCDIYIYI